MTRPDINFAVNKVCQFMHSPTSSDWQAVKRILRYLTYGISFQSSLDMSLTCYTDADWAGCPDDRCGTGGFCIFLGPNLVSWTSSKQKVVSRSSTESEYRALATATSELSWIESLLGEINAPLSSPPLLLCDNLSTTYLAANPVLHARTKHIEIDHHFIRDKVMQNRLVVHHLPSEEQLADAMTKALPSQRFLTPFVPSSLFFLDQ